MAENNWHWDSKYRRWEKVYICRRLTLYDGDDNMLGYRFEPICSHDDLHSVDGTIHQSEPLTPDYRRAEQGDVVMETTNWAKRVNQDYPSDETSSSQGDDVQAGTQQLNCIVSQMRLCESGMDKGPLPLAQPAAVKQDPLPEPAPEVDVSLRPFQLFDTPLGQPSSGWGPLFEDAAPQHSGQECKQQ